MNSTTRDARITYSERRRPTRDSNHVSSWQRDLAQCVKRWNLLAAHDVVWPAGSTLPRRTLDCYQLFYLCDGMCRIEIDAREYAAGPAELFIINPGQQHQITLCGARAVSMITLKFQPDEDAMPVRFANRIANLGMFPIQHRMEFENSLRRCAIEKNCPRAGHDQLADSLLTVCLSLLLQYDLDAVTSAEEAERTSPCARVLDYIRDHYDQPLTLDDLARVARLTPQYFCHKFNLEMGISPIGALTRTRIEAAKQLLENTALSVTEVGERVGYPEMYYFSRRFKEVIGLSPVKYRNAVQCERSLPTSMAVSISS